MNILIVRSGPYQVDVNAYNLQELGLAVALSKQGNNCSVLYYHKTQNKDETIVKDGHKINIFWRKGIRLLRSGIYPSVLKKEFLMQYDIVIASEYSQIMSLLIARKHKNTYVYNGIYYNLFKIHFLHVL